MYNHPESNENFIMKNRYIQEENIFILANVNILNHHIGVEPKPIYFGRLYNIQNLCLIY